MLSFLKPYWLEIVKWGAVVIGGLALFFSVKNSGRDAERVDNLERVMDNVEKSKTIRRGVSSANANDRLRQRWSRD